MDSRIIPYKLKRPIRVEDEVVEILEFNEPTLGDQIAFAEFLDEIAEKPAVTQELLAQLFWITKLTSLSEEVARQIKTRDHMAITPILDKLAAPDDAQGDDAGNETPAT